MSLSKQQKETLSKRTEIAFISEVKTFATWILVCRISGMPCIAPRNGRTSKERKSQKENYRVSKIHFVLSTLNVKYYKYLSWDKDKRWRFFPDSLLRQGYQYFITINVSFGNPFWFFLFVLTLLSHWTFFLVCTIFHLRFSSLRKSWTYSMWRRKGRKIYTRTPQDLKKMLWKINSSKKPKI